MLSLIMSMGTISLFAQEYTISGYIKDASNGETLIGSTVYVEEVSGGAVSNVYGFYSLTLPAGKLHFESNSFC